MFISYNKVIDLAIYKIFRAFCTFAFLEVFCCACTTSTDFSETQWLESVKATDIQSLYAPHVNSNGTFFTP